MDNQDNFAGKPTELDSPPNRHREAALSDTALLVPIPRALFIGGAGDVVLSLEGAEDEFETYTFPAGYTFIGRIAKIKTLLSGTTATNLILMW